ncbi:MAG: NADH-quinone oxidoreductase subunit A [Planctomycetes bacterium]|nr:NADH-quinone oxidoreductase subunit A [Planctomycetota bacterium]MCW8135936.1 NADH-quinone oxidoreductase subunit A [Planctomycetota bacterium]
MSADVFSILVYIALIMAVASGGLIGSVLIGKRKKGKIKNDPYECGVPQIGDTRTEFNVRFFILAMLFVLFDIETVLLAPYAATFIADIKEGKGVEYLAEVAVFLAVLGFGLLYAWRKGVLDWNVPLGQNPDDVVRQTIAGDEEAAKETAEVAHGH